MGIAGQLRTMGFGDLMQWLASSQKTGALIVEGPKYTKKLYFRHGNLLAAASDNPREMLGYYIVGWEYCSEEDLRHMVEMQDHYGVMLGELVVKMGHMSKEELDYLLLVKTKETIYDLLGWEEGEFRFADDELPGRDFLEVSLPVTSFLFEGFRQRDERRRMREAIPSSLHVPVVVSAPPEMEGDDAIMLSATDGTRNVEQLSLYLRMPEFLVLKFIHECVKKGFVMVGAPSPERQVIPGRSDAPWLNTTRDIEDRIARGRFLDALKIINGLGERYHEIEEALAFVESMKQQLDEHLDREDVDETGILETSDDLGELVNLDCEPAEGFILSRINGRYSLQEVLSQLPGGSLDNRVIIHNLLRRGLIKINQEKGMRIFRPAAAASPGGLEINELDDPFLLDD